MHQYEIIRSLTKAPQMELIIYRDGQYLILNAYQEGRRFHANFVDYRP